MVLSTFDFPVVDVWANPVGDSMLPEARRLFDQSHVNPDLIARKLSPDELVAMMDAAGVDQICLTAWYRPGMAVFSNAEVADYTRAHPTRICGIASIDLLDPVAAVAELDHYVKREGFKGLRVVPWLWNLPPTDAHYWPLYVKCVELDIPFLTQVGHTGPLCPSEVGRPIPYIDAVALKFPALKIVCGHIGHPWTAEMIAVAWKHENVFIDTSAYLPKYYPPELIRFANTTGRKKVMFGTNFPQLTWAKCVDQAAEYLREGAVIGLRADSMKDFMGGNARRVFKLGNSSKKVLSASL
ncbi:metal-dependent hydrolase [Fusarium avenaceum]|nr:metal-dependent hydrolase [Fusarium avenaceum]